MSRDRLLAIGALVLVLSPMLASAGSSGGAVADTQRFRDDWFYNPFNEHSAHHRPIGTGAVYADEQHPAVQDWLQGTSRGMVQGWESGSAPALRGSPRRSAFFAVGR